MQDQLQKCCEAEEFFVGAEKKSKGIQQTNFPFVYIHLDLVVSKGLFQKAEQLVIEPKADNNLRTIWNFSRN